MLFDTYTIDICCPQDIVLNMWNISFILKCVTDNLQRTCTGTVIIDLDGSGWPDGSIDPNTNDKGPTTDDNSLAITNNYGSDVTGSSTNGNNFGGGISTLGREIVDNSGVGQATYADNIHFGPAGIGLLIMGFLVLGCKYFNGLIYICPSPKNPLGRNYVLSLCNHSIWYWVSHMQGGSNFKANENNYKKMTVTIWKKCLYTDVNFDWAFNW